MNFRDARDRVVLIEINCGKSCYHLWASRRKTNDFFAIFSSFELRGTAVYITKHSMTWPAGNSEFCFPSTSMFDGLGETVSVGASHYVLITTRGSHLNSFPRWRKVLMILLVVVFALNFICTWVIPIACSIAFVLVSLVKTRLYSQLYYVLSCNINYNL